MCMRETPSVRIKSLTDKTMAGIASQSVSIDGLSQSIGTTQSAMFGGASARVEAYNKDIKEQILPILRQKFNGIRMVVLS